MKVVFDYQIFRSQKYGGISRYFVELARELNGLPDCSAKIAAPFHQNYYLNENAREDFVLKINPFLTWYIGKRNDDFQNKTNELSAKYMLRKRNTILHETYFTDRFNVSAPRVITVHDMIYELFNNGTDGEKYLIAKKKQAIEEADAIIAVSENTRKDLLNIYPSVQNKAFVVHHGVHAELNHAVIKYKHHKPFILYVGNRGWYKNFGTLLNVFASETKLNKNFDLIAFGGGAASEAENGLIKKFEMHEKVIFLTGDDEFLLSLYKAAGVFVYNSKYEGFGMPVLEAMQAGCPVICSDSSSLPEVAGDAAAYVNPDDESDLLNALDKVLNDEVYNAQLRQAGKERAKMFTWQRCAEETSKIYKRLINE